MSLDTDRQWLWDNGLQMRLTDDDTYAVRWPSGEVVASATSCVGAIKAARRALRKR